MGTYDLDLPDDAAAPTLLPHLDLPDDATAPTLLPHLDLPDDAMPPLPHPFPLMASKKAGYHFRT